MLQDKAGTSSGVRHLEYSTISIARDTFRHLHQCTAKSKVGMFQLRATLQASIAKDPFKVHVRKKLGQFDILVHKNFPTLQNKSVPRDNMVQKSWKLGQNHVQQDESSLKIRMCNFLCLFVSKSGCCYI